MELAAYLAQWKGQEVVAFSGPVKYRGILDGVLEGDFLVMTNVAIMNPTAGESSEYVTCVLNAAVISGLAYQEVVGRGAVASTNSY